MLVALVAFGLAGGAVAQEAVPSPLRITEFVSDPEASGADGAFEWVELANTSGEAVSLEGWRLGDARSAATLPATSVPPGGVVIVAGKSAVLPGGVSSVRLPGNIGGGLNNEGDAVRLFDPAGVIVDAVSYGEDTSVFTLRAPGRGKSLRLRALAGPRDGANWEVADRPSPGVVELAAPGIEATAGTPAGSVAGAVETPGSASVLPGVAIVEEDRQGSVVPWVMLGGAAGAGLAGLGILGRRQWQSWRGRR